MNAAERLWRGLGAHDWAAASSQFQPNAVVEWPHSGARMGVEEYLATQRERTAHGGGAFTVRRVVSEGRNVVVEGALADVRCAGFYDLHDGLIAGAVEYWVGEPA